MNMRAAFIVAAAAGLSGLGAAAGCGEPFTVGGAGGPTTTGGTGGQTSTSSTTGGPSTSRLLVVQRDHLVQLRGQHHLRHRAPERLRPRCLLPHPLVHGDGHLHAP